MPNQQKSSPQQLIEGTDYYIESGRWVFTAAYLLKRGFCCDSGCRHCPYRTRIAELSQETGEKLPAEAGSPVADS